ncbi:MAG: TIM44-related membrane protein TimA, partial [Caulobacteraceae bacterium]
VVLFQLYAVLGRRVGRGPEDLAQVAAPPTGERARIAPPPSTEAAINGLAAVRARDPNFDVEKFLEGARGAYELVVRSFHAGDRAALAPLLAPAVLSTFESAMAAREAAGREESVEFPHPPRADLESLSVAADTFRASVRFLAELRRHERDGAGERTDDSRTAEVWTFERSVVSVNPNWTLIHVDPAEA